MDGVKRTEDDGPLCVCPVGVPVGHLEVGEAGGLPQEEVEDEENQQPQRHQRYCP